ncbi:hypothetical protein NEAUS03_0823 [Nematocida ausubeli]|nr:hypothetical protein NEAUS03_0823 [Nematocida ausubeli]
MARRKMQSRYSLICIAVIVCMARISCSISTMFMKSDLYNEGIKTVIDYSHNDEILKIEKEWQQKEYEIKRSRDRWKKEEEAKIQRRLQWINKEMKEIEERKAWLEAERGRMKSGVKVNSQKLEKEVLEMFISTATLFEVMCEEYSKIMEKSYKKLNKLAIIYTSRWDYIKWISLSILNEYIPYKNSFIPKVPESSVEESCIAFNNFIESIKDAIISGSNNIKFFSNPQIEYERHQKNASSSDSVFLQYIRKLIDRPCVKLYIDRNMLRDIDSTSIHKTIKKHSELREKCLKNILDEISKIEKILDCIENEILIIKDVILKMGMRCGIKIIEELITDITSIPKMVFKAAIEAVRLISPIDVIQAFLQGKEINDDPACEFINSVLEEIPGLVDLNNLSHIFMLIRTLKIYTEAYILELKDVRDIYKEFNNIFDGFEKK